MAPSDFLPPSHPDSTFSVKRQTQPQGSLQIPGVATPAPVCSPSDVLAAMQPASLAAAAATADQDDFGLFGEDEAGNFVGEDLLKDVMAAPEDGAAVNDSEAQAASLTSFDEELWGPTVNANNTASRLLLPSVNMQGFNMNSPTGVRQASASQAELDQRKQEKLDRRDQAFLDKETSGMPPWEKAEFLERRAHLKAEAEARKQEELKAERKKRAEEESLRLRNEQFKQKDAQRVREEAEQAKRAMEEAKTTGSEQSVASPDDAGMAALAAKKAVYTERAEKAKATKARNKAAKEAAKEAGLPVEKTTPLPKKKTSAPRKKAVKEAGTAEENTTTPPPKKASTPRKRATKKSAAAPAPTAPQTSTAPSTTNDDDDDDEMVRGLWAALAEQESDEEPATDTQDGDGHKEVSNALLNKQGREAAAPPTKRRLSSDVSIESTPENDMPAASSAIPRTSSRLKNVTKVPSSPAEGGAAQWHNGKGRLLSSAQLEMMQTGQAKPKPAEAAFALTPTVGKGWVNEYSSDEEDHDESSDDEGDFKDDSGYFEESPKSLSAPEVPTTTDESWIHFDSVLDIAKRARFGDDFTKETIKGGAAVMKAVNALGCDYDSAELTVIRIANPEGRDRIEVILSGIEDPEEAHDPPEHLAVAASNSTKAESATDGADLPAPDTSSPAASSGRKTPAAPSRKQKASDDDDVEVVKPASKKAKPESVPAEQKPAKKLKRVADADDDEAPARKKEHTAEDLLKQLDKFPGAPRSLHSTAIATEQAASLNAATTPAAAPSGRKARKPAAKPTPARKMPKGAVVAGPDPLPGTTLSATPATDANSNEPTADQLRSIANGTRVRGANGKAAAAAVDDEVSTAAAGTSKKRKHDGDDDEFGTAPPKKRGGKQAKGPA